MYRPYKVNVGAYCLMTSTSLKHVCLAIDTPTHGLASVASLKICHELRFVSRSFKLYIIM